MQNKFSRTLLTVLHFGYCLITIITNTSAVENVNDSDKFHTKALLTLQK